MEIEAPKQGSYEPFKVKVKIKDMIAYARPLLNQFGRRNRDLADVLRADMNRLLHLANEVERKHCRKTTAQELDVVLADLRDFIEISAEKEYHGQKFAPPLSEHQREHWTKLLDETGRMMGGYLKTLNK